MLNTASHRCNWTSFIRCGTCTTTKLAAPGHKPLQQGWNATPSTERMLRVRFWWAPCPGKSSSTKKERQTNTVMSSTITRRRVTRPATSTEIGRNSRELNWTGGLKGDPQVRIPAPKAKGEGWGGTGNDL